MTLVTRHVRPPIPVRCWDWVAYYTDDPETIGFGSTETEALEDLLSEVVQGMERRIADLDKQLANQVNETLTA